MRLEAVVIEEFSKEYAILVERLEGQVEVIDWERYKQGSYREENLLFIAEHKKTLEYALEQNLAVLGFPGKGREDLSRARLIVEGFDDIDLQFCIRQYQRAHGIPWEILTTARTYLREQTVEDVQEVYRLYEGEGITDYMEPLFPSMEEEIAYTKEYIRCVYEFYELGLWVVIDQKSGKLIGRAGLTPIDYNGEYQLELGYVIAKEVQGQGIGEEVCLGVLDYAKKWQPGVKLNCFIDENNLPSINLSRKLGFSWKEEAERGGKNLQRYCN
ncbi:MAG: GNAT family N-acetyltransferase [Lachnospiraceae bacterium]